MCILQCLGYCPKSYVRVLKQSNTLTIAREKAAKALKEKGETPEELLQSIKENEAAAAEAQRVVDAWKAIVGEKSRREEAAKAEAERIATEKAEAERKAAEERERAEKEEKTRIEAEKKEAERIAAEKAEEEARVEAERKADAERKAEEEQRAAEEKRIAEEKAEAERKAQEERERAEEERDRIEAELDAQKADEKARLEAERKAEEEAVEKDAELKEDKKKPQIKDVVKTIYEKGKAVASKLFGRSFFDVAKTPDFMKKLGLTGDRFTIKYGVLSRHAGKDASHLLTEKQWEELPDAIQKPFAITRFGEKENGYRLYTTMKNDKGETIVVGVDVKNIGRNLEVNSISTIFGRRGDAKITQKEEVLYTDEKITPEQRSLLGQPNSDQYTDTRERNVSADKGSEKAEKKQEKQSVFDKAKEIADKEEKKRKAEAEDDSVLGQATRAVGKKKKVNLFKYTASKIISYPALRGVHYANGYAYASDGYILFKEKADYPKDWEGTTRDKDGNLIDGKYPDTEKAIHRPVYIPDKESVSLPSKEVLDFAIAASKKLKGEAIPVAIDGLFFNAVNLKKFLEAVASKGMDKIVYRHPMLYATNGKDEIVMMPTVNTLEDALDIADKMESAGLPKEQIDAWKAHIEAADKKMSLEDFKKAVENAKKEGVRHTEAEKPKEQPLTEAERKDAEEVAGALGYRVEWVDTMEENGTIDADRKVILIAKDAENPLVQVLGHEVAHGVRRMIGGKFKALQKAAMEVVGEKEWNERIEKKRKLNAYAEGKLAEEVTCDIVGEALNDKDALKRLAESLRGERGILARLRDAVAKMVEYFKNRGDKEGVRRMKAADKLLAEFESALKEGVAPEQVKPEDVDRSVRENRSEKTELTAEERELRDNLVERMRKGGLDVVTDSEEMQRVIDTENERTRNKRSKKSEAARKRDEALYAVDWSTAFVSGKSREEATEIRRERGRKFKEETKELYGRVLSGNFDDVTLRLIDEFIDKSTPNNPYERPISKRLPTRALQKMRGGERTGSVDALFSRICESTVGKDGKTLPRAERERAIEEKKKELLKKWAIATGNWHTDVSDFSDGKEPIGSGTDSDVYLSKDGKSVIKVSKGKPYGKRFRPDVDNVALFNTVFPGSRYTIEGYGEIDGKFVRFLKQPFVDFSDSTPLTEGERVAYMEKLGFKPINKENTAFSNGEIVASDLQKSNVVRDRNGNVRVIDADMKLHTKDVGGNYSYPDVETDTTGLAEREEVNTGSVREHRVYHGSGADFDAFDHSHMGEGEGAQAYGWGTYVTEVEGIGRTYAEQNATTHNDALRALQHDVDVISYQLDRHRDDLKYDEEQLKRANEWRAEAELDYELFKDEAEKLKEKYGESSPKYRNHLFNDIYTDEMKRAQRSVKSTEESIQYRKEKIAELEKALKDKQAEIDELPKEFPRHLYTVEIPDDNGSNYLDWNGHPAESLLKDVGSFLESEGFERVQDNPARYEKGESTVVLNPKATGADLYAELQKALGSDKKASQALAELGCIGIKYPADNMRGGREDGANNYVIFNENDAKITDHTRFLRTADGEVYGLVKDGRIYLDPKVATSETAVHEYTHLWGDMLRRKDSEQWSHTVKELKNSVLWEEVKESYPELKTDDEIADEVLSTFSGRRGAERLREEARRVAEGDGGVFTKAKAIEALERVKEAIARFWEGVARMFGINRYRSAEELADMAMKDLLDSKNPMKDESGMRKRGEVGETLATSGTYFSGGGLLEAGLKGVIDPKVAVEFSEKIAGVYADNHGNHIVVADVRDVDPKKLVGAVDGGEVQYFHASPVCKNFSKAKREGGEVELDKETALSTAEFIAKTRPKVVTIENVKGYRNSEALKIITDELTRQGYDWDADVYNTADYGGYTKRERLIVRAKRDGKLPPKPEKLPEELRKKGWYSAVEDLIPHLEEKKTGVPQGTDERLKNSGIDYRTIDKPLYVFGRGYANKTVGHAFADELLPTLTTGGGDIIIMPDGRVLKASPRVLARVTGLPDTYKMPETDQLSHTIVGNGIPTQLTEGVIAPLLDNAIPSAERATKRESVFDVADRVSQNLEERMRAMAVKKVNDRFNEELELQVKGELEEGHVYKLGMPSEILLSTGVPNLPIELSAKQLSKKAADRGHRFDVKDIANLPQAIQAPIAVFEYGNKDKSQNLIVEIERDGKKFVVGIHFNQDRRGIVVNDIRGLFNKDSHEWLNWVSQGKLLYADKEKIQALIDKQRTNLAEVNYLNLDDVAKKVKDFENPKLFDGKISEVDKKGSDSIERSVRENPKNEDKPRFSRKPGESIFDYASRVSEDVDRSVRERVSARDEYEKNVKSKGFQTKEALQNSMLGLQEFMSAIDRASGNKRYIEDIPDFENPILGENRLSSVNKEEMHQVAKTQFKPLMSAVAKLSGNGKESGELYDYMFAKHGLERDAVMRQREAQKEFDKYQKANPKGTKTIGDFVASLEGKDYAGLTALTAEDGRVKSIQSQIDAIDEQMEATDNQLLLHYLGGQKKRLKVDLLNAARDAADDIRKTFENNPSHDRSDINELWSRVNEVNGNTLRKLYESGMLTKEAYNDISSMYTNYIPMRGFDQTTSADAYAYLTHGDSAFNAPIKTAKGRSSKADNPIAYMQAMAESAIMQGNRNVLVKQKMLNFVRNHPSDLASVSDVWLQYDSVADEWKPMFPDNIGANDSASVVAKKMEAFEDKMKQMAEKHPDLVQRSNEAPDIPYKVVEKGQLNEHQVLVKQNGKSYIITVNGSPRAAQAANGLTNPDTDFTGAVGKVLEGAEALNRQLSSLYTTFKPGFVGSNYVRDALYSNTMVYVKEGAKYGGSFNLNFAKYNPAEMANLYARYNKGSLDTSNETHRLFLEFMQNGGETGFVNLKQIEKRKSEIAKAIKRDGRISAERFFGGLNNAVDFANKSVENSARFAAYVTSRKSGRSVGRSVYDAKEISVNFNRKGSGRNWWKDNVGTSRFYDTEIGLVEINRASVGSSLAHRYSQVKLDVITSLAEGFNNAVYFGSMQDFSRQEGVKSHYFAYPINYNGNRNYVFCRAMQDANKSRLYVHEVFLADNIEKGNTLQTAASQPHGGITLYKDILANVLAANVTNDSETSKPCFSRKPGESIFDYASRVSEDVDRSVCEGR